MDNLAIVASYHQRTKHAFNRYARSAGLMDWDNQPDPFRRFSGASTIQLTLGAVAETSYDALFSREPIDPCDVNRDSISALFELSLALSAWKEIPGARWALRINPSSGNLHPTEGYLIAGPLDSISDTPGVYHYAPKDHCLEHRCTFGVDLWKRLTETMPSGTFFVGLSSIHWREAWKYGERAFRYCQHDVGHAIAAICLSASILGWSTAILSEMSDADIASLLGLSRDDDFKDAEREEPDVLIAITPQGGSSPTRITSRSVDADAVAELSQGIWTGKANRLSPDHVDWEVIQAVTHASKKPLTTSPSNNAPNAAFAEPIDPERPPVSASSIIRQRRSAVAMDGRTSLSANQFYLMMDRLLPRMGHPVFDALESPACVHLGLFVHLVEDLPPGLYVLDRSQDHLASLRQAMKPSFSWTKPDGIPDGLPLYLLEAGDVRRAAWQVSCTQEIAGAGAFSCAMIAEFKPLLQENGPWFYRRLFWETGMIGQILYLEAEAAGVRGTGIGCYFDDPVHELFGLQNDQYQSLYHFTIGGPVEDGRLSTLPPYPTNK